MVRTRNIFDPERTGPATPQAPPPQGPVSQADYAALTGVLVTPEKTLAFFSGSRPEYSKVLATGGKIAGATVSKIGPGSVEVTRQKKTVTVAIGQTVPLDANTVPGPAPAPVPAIPAPTPSSYAPQPNGITPISAAPAAGSPASTGSAADREAVLRRMMERRQRELR